MTNPNSDSKPRPRRISRAWLVGLVVLATAGIAVASYVLTSAPARCPAGQLGLAFVADGRGARCDGADATNGTVGVGHELTTGNAEVALTWPNVFTAQLAPGTSVLPLDISPANGRLRLNVGAVHLRTAPGGRPFVVETPATTATIASAEVSLQVADSGQGQARVLTGEVEFSSSFGTVTVPNGFTSDLDPDLGAGVPVAFNAPALFIEALRMGSATRFDSAGLAAAREQDALTLANLAMRLGGPAKRDVLARLATLRPGAPAEPVLSRDQILAELRTR